MKLTLTLLIILALAAVLRFSHLNWDSGFHLHPDERFLTLVALELQWPRNLFEYFDASISVANPGNHGFTFFVYGTFPVLLVKWLSGLFSLADYSHLTLVGRTVSAGLDLLLVYLVYHVASKLSSRSSGLFAAFFYSLSVLPIQLAHFFTTDTFLVFFLFLTFVFIQKFSSTLPSLKLIDLGLGLGSAMALAVSSKINALLFLPIIALCYLFHFLHHRRIVPLIWSGFFFLVSFYLFLRLAQPYLFASPNFLNFHLNPEVISSWQVLKSLNLPETNFPPGIQWLNISRPTYSLTNLALWGLGLPLFAISLPSLIFALFQFRRQPVLFLAGFWSLGLFLYTSTQFSQPMRYLYPIYPFLAVCSGVFAARFSLRPHRVFLLTLAVLIWPLAFIGIYSAHPRVAASSWITSQIPAGSRLTCEHWDDCLPLSSSSSYHITEIHLYDPDTVSKWQLLSPILSQTDYIILTSNRLFGSISANPAGYPLTSRYYSLLFSGQLGFTPVAQFTSRPFLPWLRPVCLTPPGISYGQVAHPIQECPRPGLHFVDDYADESFTVYDHPKVIIFANSSHLSPQQLYQLVTRR